MYRQQQKIIAGLDEAGRGPLAGPVVTAAVILANDFQDSYNKIKIQDSKKISEKNLIILYEYIKSNALDYNIQVIPAAVIDDINILQATLLGFKQCVENLKIKPNLVLIDGNQAPKLSVETQTIIKGDQSQLVISAAAILAKVTRDNIMRKLDKIYPEYNFAKHKGYPTKDHLLAIQEHGVTQEHRTSFGPVKRQLQNSVLQAKETVQ